MVAKLKEKNSVYYCSNCRMRQYKLEPTCFFCEALFSNYEEVMIEIFKKENN